MSYRYGTNGNDLNWGFVTCLDDMCVECCGVDDEDEMVMCENHTHIYYDSDLLPPELKENGDFSIEIAWYIIHDTNTNFVTLCGDVPDEYLSYDYILERNKARGV